MLVRRAVRKDVVNDQADEREEEDDQAPDQLLCRRAARFDDLDCSSNMSVCGLWSTRWAHGVGRTDHNDVQNQNNKSDESTAGAVLPAVVQRLGRDGRGKAQRGQAQL